MTGDDVVVTTGRSGLTQIDRATVAGALVVAVFGDDAQRRGSAPDMCCREVDSISPFAAAQRDRASLGNPDMAQECA